MSGLDYDRLSPAYDERYRVNPLTGIEDAIAGLVEDLRPALSIEVGCGTGRWLPALSGSGSPAIGVDPFPGMLARVPRGNEHTRLLCADGDHLPFQGATFDLIVSVNAIHHLDDPGGFIGRCFGLLKRGGRLALVHHDPARSGQSWYVYDYFEGTYKGDLERFSRADQLLDWMLEAGFESLEVDVAETIERHYSGHEVLDDYFLGKDSNSTLACLDQSTYEGGLAELRREIEICEARGESLRSGVLLELLLLSARKP